MTREACAVAVGAGIACTLPFCVRAAQAPGETHVIEEIVVTATKREGQLQDTALSVAVLSGETLDDMGARSLHDYWRSVPSLAVADQGFAGNRITIRGLGEEPGGITESMTAVYFDETPINQADGLFAMSPDFALVDLERVEVLRGPQGTLFGASAMGGALRLIPRQPDASARSLSIDAALSSTAHGGDNGEIAATWNQPLSPDSALRLVALHRELAGFVDDIGSGADDYNDERTTALRAAYRGDLGSRFSLAASLAYQDRAVGGMNYVDPNGKPTLGLATSGSYEVALLSDQFRDDEVRIVSLAVEYDGNGADWLATASRVSYETFLQIDLAEEATFILGDYAALVSTGDFEQTYLVQEIRAAAKPDARLQWLLGAYHLDQEAPRDEAFLLDGGSIQSLNTSDDRRDLAVFGELGWPLSDTLIATVGLRWFDVRKRATVVSNGFTTGFTDVVTSLSYDERGAAPKLSLAWHLSEDIMLYALASQGFRAGGGNTPLAVAQCGAPGAYESDELRNYELGLRSRFSGDRYTLNATAYHLDWSDAQLDIEVPGCNDAYIDNVGEASSDGLELEFNARIEESWELSLSGTLNRSRIDETVPNSGGIEAGADIPLVPRAGASLASAHRFTWPGGREGFLRLDWQYTGRSHTSLFPFFDVRQDAYQLLNLRIGAQLDRWTVTLFADNIADEQASLLCCRIDGGFTTNRPRTVGVRAALHWD